MDDQTFGGDAAARDDLHRRLLDWRPDRVGTLLFLRCEDQVLLIHKRRGHGAGKINGPGGKPEPGESPAACVLRETHEEVGIEVHDARQAAVFRFVDTRDHDWLGLVFTATAFAGEPRPSAEAEPFWAPVDALPLERMWDDDRYWLPRLLAGERLEGDFLFAAGRLLAHRLRRLGPHEAFPAWGRIG